MCEVCDKEVYFNTEWYRADCGYGDNDYGGINRHTVETFICPACGKLKVKSAENKFGSIEKALVFLLMQNMPENSVKEEQMALFEKIIDDAHIETCEEILKNMGLSLDEGYFRHKCGHVLAKNVKVDSKMLLLDRLEKILSSKNMNFCPCCGERIYPFNRNIDLEVPGGVHSYIVESKKTWDRSE